MGDHRSPDTSEASVALLRYTEGGGHVDETMTGEASAARVPTTSTERTRRWRERHPERRQIERDYSDRYRGTAKGQLSTIRHKAKSRGAT